MKIGVFDSGHGGTTVLSAIKEILPDEEYYYIADSEHCPYGEKTDEELYPIVTANVEKLQEWGAEIVVVACNTATVRCLKRLRSDYPELQFVGTEPAIKVAIESGAQNILVLATPGTVESERTRMLINENQRVGQSIKLLPCFGLADTIEHNYKNGRVDDAGNELTDKLQELFADETDVYDVVVLGCTHYPLIAELIQSFFANASLVDGNAGVAKRVKAMMQKSL